MAANITQASYRISNDNGSETTATYMAAINTAAVFKPDTTFRVRFLITDPGTTSPSETLTLYYSKAGGAYVVCNASASNIRPAASANFVDGASTTTGARRLGTGVANSPFGYMDQGDGVETTFTLTLGMECEVEFALQLRSADISAGNYITLQCRNGSTVLTNYTNSAKLMVAAAPAKVTETFTAKAVAFTVKVKPGSVAATFSPVTSTIKNGPVKAPATVSAAFTGQATKFTVKLVPSAVAELFTAAQTALKISIHPSVTSESFVAATTKLASTIHSATVAAAFSARTSALALAVHPAVVSAAFSAMPVSFKTSFHPSAVSVVFTGAN